MSVANNICSSAVIHTGADSSRHIHEFQKSLADNIVIQLRHYSAAELRRIRIILESTGNVPRVTCLPCAS